MKSLLDGDGEPWDPWDNLKPLGFWDVSYGTWNAVFLDTAFVAAKIRIFEMGRLEKGCWSMLEPSGAGRNHHHEIINNSYATFSYIPSQCQCHITTAYHNIWQWLFQDIRGPSFQLEKGHFKMELHIYIYTYIWLGTLLRWQNLPGRRLFSVGKRWDHTKTSKSRCVFPKTIVIFIIIPLS